MNANFTAAKTAIDDNNTRITANAASAATNTTNVTANAASAATNAASAATNAASAATNAASAATNTTDIAANVTNITTLQNAKSGYATAVGNPVFNTTTVMTATGQAVVTLTMNAPANGFAIVKGQLATWINHAANTLDVVVIKVSATSGDVADHYDVSIDRVEAVQPVGLYIKTLSASSVIPVVAGPNLIYLNAYATAGTGHRISDSKLTAIYVPNAY